MDTEHLVVQLLVALSAALVGGALASWLRQPPILGFLASGLVLGPFTPGLVAPQASIDALAEVGVIFLMFAVGVQLSLPELLRSGRTAIGGAVIQVLATIGLGFVAGLAMGWSPLASLVFGAVLSNSSSTVLSRVLIENDELETPHGKLGLAWSSVQDVSTILLVAVFSALSPNASEGHPWIELAKGVVFLLFVAPAALWLLPRVFERVALARSQELFTVSVATVALGMAWTAAQLGVSLALGAFVAGVVVGESPRAHRILGEAIPLRDIFSGMFFVSIGMSIDPGFVASHWPYVTVAAALTIVGKGVLTAWVARLVGCTRRVAVKIGAGLGQSAEFSFILAQVGQKLGLIGPEVFGTLLAGAVISILAAPAMPAAANLVLGRLKHGPADRAEGAGAIDGGLTHHTVVCGYGRVGRVVVGALHRLQVPLLVIEEEPAVVRSLQQRGLPALEGDAAQIAVLERAGVARARVLVICVPERMAVRRIIDYARARNPGLVMLARTHRESERRHLHELGASTVVMGELELALELGRRSAEALGIDAARVAAELEHQRSAAG
jgi:monovalent cation:H+ antiporter-2, CPA2 family